MRATVDVSGWLGLSARVETDAIARGERGRLIVTLAVPEGCHIQSHEPAEPFLIPTVLELDAPGGLAVGRVEYPVAERERFDWSPVVIDVYRGRVEVVVPIEVEAGTTPGRRTVSGRVRYQGCTETACLPPAERTFDVAVSVV